MGALRILDRLRHTGAEMSYDYTQEAFTLNLQAGDVASCTRVTHLLFNALPNNFKLKLTLPNGALGHFAQAALTKLQKKYPQTLTVANYSPIDYTVAQTTSEYAQLRSLSDLFTYSDSSLYARLNNKQELHQSIALLRQILQGEDTELQYLVYEFFMVHQLCSFPAEINNMSEFDTVIRNNKQPEAIEQLRKNIFALLNSESHAVSAHLRKSLPVVETSKTPGGPPTPFDVVKAKTRVVLQAKAWWGKIAFEEINQNSIDGIYWYGRFLHEFPLRTQENPGTRASSESIAKVSETGLYWIRLAATHHKNTSAHNYLSTLFSRQPSLAPLERYQLTLVSEELKIPPNIGEAFIPHHNFLKLFPHHDFWVRFNETMSFWAPERAPYAQEHLFYLKLLLQDNLITEKAKLSLLKQLTNGSNAYAWTVSSQLKRHKKELTLTHGSALGAQIQAELVPILDKYKKDGKKVTLDNSVPMSELPQEQRVAAFCQLLAEHLELYLKKRMLFGTEIAEDADPSYVAVLIHELLTQSINHFALDNTQLDKELNKVMQSMKQALQENAFRRTFAMQPASFGFAQAMTNRFVSYSTTAYVANVSGLSLLKKFGEKQAHDHDGISVTNVIAGGALAIESLHVALPLVLAATGVTLPVTGVWAVLAGLQVALNKIHHYAAIVEETAEAGKLATDLVVGLAHGHHLAHEAGLIAHKHHDGSPPLVELDTIKYFNSLLQSASVKDIDSITTLINQWGAIYQPATDKLTATSNNLLGILLVELLMRGLTLRLYAEQQNLAIKTEHPKSLPALLDYLNETLWLYSCPRTSDDTYLVTKSMKAFSALDFIFPRRLKVNHSEKPIDIAIEPANRPEKRTSSMPANSLTRYASNYEVQQINQLRVEMPTRPAFTLVNGGHQALIDNNLVDVAYDKWSTLRDEISFLYKKDELHDLQTEIQRCEELISSVYEKVITHHVEDKEKFNLLIANLKIVRDILANSIIKLKNPNLPSSTTFADMSKFVFNNPKLSPHVAVGDFLAQLASFLILYNRKHQLGIDRLENHIYAGLEKACLEDMAKLLDQNPGVIPITGPSKITDPTSIRPPNRPSKKTPDPVPKSTSKAMGTSAQPAAHSARPTGSQSTTAAAPKLISVKVSETKVGLFAEKEVSGSKTPVITSSLAL